MALKKEVNLGLGTWKCGLSLGGPIAPNREVIKGFGLLIPLP